MNTTQIKIKDSNVDKVLEAVKDIIPDNEIVYVALKGAFKEYLICTDKMVHIIKKGFMTGHTFGSGDFKMPYENITNAEVDMHILSGYFELSAGGLQNKKLNYWSSDKNEDPTKQPNVISINSKSLAQLFRDASQFILNQAAQLKAPSSQNVTQVSVADEIKKFKELLDQGIITQEEFDIKKKQLLGI